MRTTMILALSTLIITAPSVGEAQRRYKVYKTDRFGNKGILSEPEAIIEQDSLSGDWEVYEATPFGFPDTLRGPIYIIENDSLRSLSHRHHDDDFNDEEHHHHHHPNDDTDCDREHADDDE
jgi:hypothetical protein